MPGTHQSTRRLQIESPRKAYESVDYNLGSISAIVDGSGNLLSEQRYMPFGEVRTEIGTITQTDFSFTGQRSISMLSIMDYIARFYDPAIGRFVSPDSIVSDPSSPQSLNRYSYVLNRPVNLNDPSGHKPCWATKKYSCHLTQDQIVTLLKSDNENDRNFIANLYHAQSWWTWATKQFAYGKNDCTLSLLECYYSSPMRFMAFEEGQQIDLEQFNELLIAVYFDLKSMDGGLLPLFSWDLVRGWFDTPFYGGEYAYRNELTQSYQLLPVDTTRVCVAGVCSDRNDINYFAQGMWGAASGQTLEEVYSNAERWKHLKSSALSVDAKYWIEYGYNKYLEF